MTGGRPDVHAAVAAITRVVASRESLDEALRAFGEAVAGLVRCDSIAVGVRDDARGDLEVLDVVARSAGGVTVRDTRLPLAHTLAARVLAGGEPIRIADLARDDVPDASREILGRGGYRSALVVPLLAAGAVIGVVTLAAREPMVFDGGDAEVVTELARPVGWAIERRRLGAETRRRAEELRALLEAGRAVTASLDVARTMRVIMEQARAVLDVASCGIMTVDPASGELVNVASLDLPATFVGTIRIRSGEGLTGRAFAERRPVQSRDLWLDDRSAERYRPLQRNTGFRSLLAVPLREGEQATGVLYVFRHDVHDFSPAEQELLVALADQAAIALEHARLYERLEGMVVERTRELHAEKRFVEVVLETLPLGVFVLDGGRRVRRVNHEGGRVLPADAAIGAPFARWLGERGAAAEALIDDVLTTRRVRRVEEELVIAGESRIVRLTAAPLDAGDGGGLHVIVLAEDVTLAKRLERQMLLTERLTTAGRLAAGVAHELNNPLATIAGCAEALTGRLGEARLTGAEIEADFRRYLGIIEEEAFRCKEITGSLLQFVREPGGRRTPTDVNALVVKAVELLSHQSRFAESEFTTELTADMPLLTVNEGQLRQVFLGLAANALEAMEGRGVLTIRTRVVRDDVEVEFEDIGPGMSDDVLARIFDPFFTTKPPGQGTGLGLAIAQGIVADHAGRIEVTSRPGKGSLFRVVLPR